MSDAQTLIANGDAGSSVRGDLNELQTRFNESWRQILALSSSGSFKAATKSNTFNSFHYFGGGGYTWVLDYVATGITATTTTWTVDATGTYYFVFRDMKFNRKPGGHVSSGLMTAARLGIGAWVDGIYYELQNYGWYPSGVTGFLQPVTHGSGVSALSLTAGQVVSLGTACIYAASSTFAKSGYLHEQGATQVAHMDVYLAEVGA